MYLTKLNDKKGCRQDYDKWKIVYLNLNTMGDGIFAENK